VTVRNSWAPVGGSPLVANRDGQSPERGTINIVIPSAPTAPTVPPRDTEPTHPCIRCGDPVGPGVGLCERCNPLGLRDVASTQAHGAIFLAIVLGVVLLAVAGRFAVSGIGPFTAKVDSAVPTPNGAALAITLTVTNTGSSAGQTTCRVTEADNRGGGPSSFLLSPQIQPGATVTFTGTASELGTTPGALVTECQSP
jgi:hypothetical protein